MQCYILWLYPLRQYHGMENYWALTQQLSWKQSSTSIPQENLLEIYVENLHHFSKCPSKNKNLDRVILILHIIFQTTTKPEELWAWASTSLYFNPFVPNALLLCPLKTSVNHNVFCWFQGVEKGCIGNKWIKYFQRVEVYFHVSGLVTAPSEKSDGELCNNS